MRVIELLTQVRNTLQDIDKTHWTDSELLNHYNDCRRQINAERLEDSTTAVLALDSSKNIYDTSGVLRYISATDDLDNTRLLYPDDGTSEGDSNGIIIEAYNRINVISPEIGTAITMKVIAFPSDSNLDSDVRSGDEMALKNYVMSKAYEQETDMENFQKAGYFYGKYQEYLKALLSAKSTNYTTKIVNNVQSYSF